MTVVATWDEGRVRVEERDTGFAIIRNGVRFGPLYTRKYRATEDAELLAGCERDEEVTAWAR